MYSGQLRLSQGMRNAFRQRCATQLILMLMIVHRTLAAGALTLSILVYTHILSGYHVMFLLQPLMQFPPQLWRLISPFLVTGPDLGILFDTYFRKARRIALQSG